MGAQPDVTSVGWLWSAATLSAIAKEFGSDVETIRNDCTRLEIPIVDFGGQSWVHILALTRSLVAASMPRIRTEADLEKCLQWLGQFYPAARRTAILDSLRAETPLYKRWKHKRKVKPKPRQRLRAPDAPPDVPVATSDPLHIYYRRPKKIRRERSSVL